MREIKEDFGVSKLSFYISNQYGFCCRFVSSPEVFDYSKDLSSPHLKMLLLALSSGKQASVYFDDIGEVCNGMAELRSKYLVLELSGI